MEAKELRIGNWVRFIDKNEEFQIGCISHNEIEMGFVLLSEVDPIPLTEEWLLKLGFEKKSGSEFKKGRFIYRFQQRDLIIEGFEYDYNGIICHPEYVHQLQNLYFALTNEELEITPIPQT